MWWEALIFSSPKAFLTWFGLGSILGGDIGSGFIFIFFLGTRFSGVTLALVSPVNTELIDRSVWSLYTTIIYGYGASNWVIKFGPLVTFCFLINYLGNAILPQIGATTSSFAFYPLSLDDALFLTGSLILVRFNLV